MSNNNTFIDFRDISRNSKNKKIILFGAGEIATKTIRKLDTSPSYIVDNNPNMHGSKDNALSVNHPRDIKKELNISIIIICTTSFQEVSIQLNEMGFKKNLDYFVSPILNDLLILSQLSDLKTEIIFSSGAPISDNEDYGGGIYKVSINGLKYQVDKKINGTTHGIIKKDSFYYANNHKYGLIKFNKNFEILKKIEMPMGSRPHGLTYSKLTNKFYIVLSYRDSFLIINDNFEIEDEVFISDKFKDYNSPVHHCNDICNKNSSIFVSMFSKSGNWKNDVFDGCIMEIDIKSKKIIGSVKENLWMPHNVTFIDGGLTVLDSLTGELLKDNFRVIGKFPGFTRGILFDGGLFFIGQSRNRNFSKYLGNSYNISIDTSIIVFDDKSKVSRSIHLDPRISEIHSIIN
tara:strand:- start:26 stop:1234 length:1209 start_codon:yes stop_codon:yes gene_type:complete